MGEGGENDILGGSLISVGGESQPKQTSTLIYSVGDRVLCFCQFDLGGLFQEKDGEGEVACVSGSLTGCVVFIPNITPLSTEKDVAQALIEVAGLRKANVSLMFEDGLVETPGEATIASGRKEIRSESSSEKDRPRLVREGVQSNAKARHDFVRAMRANPSLVNLDCSFKSRKYHQSMKVLFSNSFFCGIFTNLYHCRNPNTQKTTVPSPKHAIFLK